MTVDSWYHICKHLPVADLASLALASKPMRGIVQESLAAYALQFEDDELLEREIEWIACNVPKVTSIDLKNRITWAPRIFDAIARMTGLRHLDARNANEIQDEQVVLLAANLRHLQSFHSDAPQITEIGANAIAQNFPDLTQLSLENVSLSSNFRTIAAAHPHLTFLSVAKVPMTTVLKEAILSLKSLRHLNIVDTGATHKDITDFTSGLPQLLGLKIGTTDWPSDPQVTDRTVTEIVGKHPNLHELGLYNTKVTLGGFQAIAPRLTELRKLAMTYCQFADEAAKVVAKHQLYLRVLDLENSGRVLDLENSGRVLDLENSGLSNAGIKVLAPLPLEELNAFGTEIDDEGVQVIASSYEKLTKLNIGSTKATSVGVMALVNHKTLKELSKAFITLADKDLINISSRIAIISNS